jgi:hypothetical protein
MAVQGHTPAAEEPRRAVVGVARALGRRALVLLLLGIDVVRAGWSPVYRRAFPDRLTRRYSTHKHLCIGSDK